MNSEQEEPEYTVERIVEKRVRHGRVEYKIKWLGFDDADNTWEPEENCDCPDLVAAFEKKLKEKAEEKFSAGGSGATNARRKSGPSSKVGNPPTTITSTNNASTTTANSTPTATTTSTENSSPKKTPKPSENEKGAGQTSELRGFDRGLEAEKIIGATDSSGDLMFLMKWKNSDEADLVPARQANHKCPQTVIQFYEERLTWRSSSNEGGGQDKENTNNSSQSQSSQAAAAKIALGGLDVSNTAV